MAEIHLANGQGVALVDDDDALRLPSTGWYLRADGYVARHTTIGQNQHVTGLLHRLVLKAPKGLDVDHINHDRRDCRRRNLRLATRSQNMQNRRGAQRNNRVGIRGVMAYQTKTQGIRYRAAVQIGGKNHFRFGFSSASEADVAARELRRVHLTHSLECGPSPTAP